MRSCRLTQPAASLASLITRGTIRTRRLSDEDKALQARLQALRSSRTPAELPSDAEMLARVQHIRGAPAIAPRPVPPGGFLPLSTSAPINSTDAHIGRLFNACCDRGGTHISEVDEADELLRAASDAVRLGGGAASSAATADLLTAHAGHGDEAVPQ